MTFFSSNKLVASRKLIFALLVGGLLLAPAVRLRAQDVAPASVAHDAQSPSSAQSSGGSRRELEEDETKEYRQSDSVKKVGALLGLSPENSAMAFEVFNFVVMALLLGWVIAKNLPKTFRNRSSAIQKDLVDARIATEEAGLRLSGVEARLANGAGGEIALRGVECLSVCKRPCTVALAGPGKWTYVVGDLDSYAGVDDSLDAAAKFAATDDGIIPWRERPLSFRRGVVSRTPPLPELPREA